MECIDSIMRQKNKYNLLCNIFISQKVLEKIILSIKLKQDISIGDNLRRLRKKAGLSQEEVAAKLQVMELPASREIISQMELGKYSIRISILLAMKTIYKVESMDEFFESLID